MLRSNLSNEEESFFELSQFKIFRFYQNLSMQIQIYNFISIEILIFHSIPLQIIDYFPYVFQTIKRALPHRPQTPKPRQSLQRLQKTRQPQVPSLSNPDKSSNSHNKTKPAASTTPYKNNPKSPKNHASLSHSNVSKDYATIFSKNKNSQKSMSTNRK